MTHMLITSLDWSDWSALFGHYLLLSLLSVGGALATTPEMHRYLVQQQHWLTAAQFNASITLAQAAPGPNILFVALLGWNIGINAGGYPSGLLGMALTMTGILLPSTVLTYLAGRWGQRNRDRRSVRAFKQGMAPIVVGLLFATAWLLLQANDKSPHQQRLWMTALVAMLLVWRTRLHLLWLLGAGALLGWFGWI